MATQEKTAEKKTLQELREGVKIEICENINQIDIHIGKFTFTISADTPEYYNVNNGSETIYGSFGKTFITANAYTKGKVVKEGRNKEIRHVTFYKKRNKK